MKSFDTNVVVRLLVLDDPEQCRRAESAWRAAVTTGGAFLSKIVIVEAAWVLRVAYKFDRATLSAALGRLLGSEGVTVEDEPVVLAALAQYRADAADLSDYVILETAKRDGALPLLTFDEKLAGASGAELVP